MPVAHYENFPVASWLAPAALRPAIVAIYHFARAADDIADEGDAEATERLSQLDHYEAMLDRIASERWFRASAVFGFWPATSNKKIFVVKSTNGGGSFQNPDPGDSAPSKTGVLEQSLQVEPDQDHLRRSCLIGRAGDLFQALEQDLPGARQDRHWAP